MYIELIFVLIIVAISCTLTAPSFNSFIYSQCARLTLQQIQQAINYARSLAIVTAKPVIICPSLNRYSCSGGWNDGLLVIAPNEPASFFKVYIAYFCYLSLTQNGNSGSKITINADGMTYNNGNFNYRALKYSDFPKFKLYFNKGLRTYMTNG